jgi:hypothetical protein
MKKPQLAVSTLTNTIYIIYGNCEKVDVTKDAIQAVKMIQQEEEKR